ncbi:MAG TPA: mechanosensitive ion channel family protein [Burkholderiales bacterium]|nr:mechanosensitive ion channel family protein [Burkholderiales bacterium]
MNQNLDDIEHVKNLALDMGLRFGPKLVVAIVILGIGVVVGRWVGKLFEGMLRKLELDITIRILLVRTVRVLVLGLFAIMALQNLGIELLPLIAGLGIAGAGVALAMQGVLANVAAGLTIIFTRPYRVGEYISIVHEEGVVEVVSLFNTILGHTDLSKVVIPNRKIVGEILHNYGKLRQLDLSVGVAYDADLNRALAAVEDVLKDNARVLKDPAPVIQISTLADSSIDIAVKPWVAVSDYIAAGGEVNKAMVETFRIRGIVMPFPQREVRILSAA